MRPEQHAGARTRVRSQERHLRRQEWKVSAGQRPGSNLPTRQRKQTLTVQANGANPTGRQQGPNQEGRTPTLTLTQTLTRTLTLTLTLTLTPTLTMTLTLTLTLTLTSTLTLTPTLTLATALRPQAAPLTRVGPTLAGRPREPGRMARDGHTHQGRREDALLRGGNRGNTRQVQELAQEWVGGQRTDGSAQCAAVSTTLSKRQHEWRGKARDTMGKPAQCVQRPGGGRHM